MTISNPLCNEVSLMLFISSTYKIEMVAGTISEVFHPQFDDIFGLNQDITTLRWSELFIQEPDLNLNEQILFTKDQQKVLFTITKVNTNEFEFIITLINVTKGIHVKAQLNAQGQGTELSRMAGASKGMSKIMDLVHKISRVNSTVLLLGESGVGKSFLAREIHALSERTNHPFVSLNCGSLPKDLIESELFGYEPGTFTGGKKGGKIGLFEAADQGTIFLDEIGELPYDIQSKLLEVLQEGTIRKIGGVQAKQIDVRIIAATNQDLAAMVARQTFRKDLFYRLNVVPLRIPPLKERKEEIPLLINHFLTMFNKKYNQSKNISRQFKKKLVEYEWPGNIRELENIIERIVVTNSEDVFEFLLKEGGIPLYEENTVSIEGLIPLKEAKKIVEKELILRAHHMYGSTYKAAKALQVDQSTIVKKLKQYKETGTFEEY
ncbi:sigma-54 interaction domain-containing protein [Brevibacillus sp. NRS-1366]|uniref:sigma-54 interaction domain-containing protein n=1 Tax=Brevibacillus sp. NRS-1366 TaxID=3233899 RepID=UPI003D1BBF54